MLPGVSAKSRCCAESSMSLEAAMLPYEHLRIVKALPVRSRRMYYIVAMDERRQTQ